METPINAVISRLTNTRFANDRRMPCNLRLSALHSCEDCVAFFARMEIKIYLLIFNNLQDKIHFLHCVFLNHNMMKGKPKLFIGLSPVNLS